MCYFKEDKRYFKKLWCLTVYVGKIQARLSKNTVIILRSDSPSTNFKYAQNSGFIRMRFNFVNAYFKAYMQINRLKKMQMINY